MTLPHLLFPFEFNNNKREQNKTEYREKKNILYCEIKIRKMIMIKLKSKKYFCRSISKLSRSDSGNNKQLKGGDQNQKENNNNNNNIVTEIKWEMRPGGMLVQRRESVGTQTLGEGLITIRVSTVSKWHDISIESTSTFGN